MTAGVHYFSNPDEDRATWSTPVHTGGRYRAVGGGAPRLA